MRRTSSLLSCHLFIISLLMLLPETPRAQTANCSTSCGQLQIPYPFGIGYGCARRANERSSFQLDCINDTPFLGPYEVTNISLSTGEITVKLPIFWQCSGGSSVSSTRLPFPLSRDRNQFVALGCNTISSFTLNGDRGNLAADGVLHACASMCTAVHQMRDGVCSGVGCCKIDSIPADTFDYSFRLRSFDDEISAAGYDNCSYAFMVEKSKFVFNWSMLYSGILKTEKMPVVLEWYIEGSCNDSSESFACISRNATAHCSRHGYRCNCADGYEGNPYLRDGCQDIDECKDPDGYHCWGTCTNTIGGYNCTHDYGFSQVNHPFVLIIIAGASGFGGLMTLIVFSGCVVMCCKCARRRKTRYRRKVHFIKLLQQLVSTTDVEVERTKIFPIAELKKATDKFSETRIIGRGGHGVVFKGLLTDQTAVAIKTAKFTNEQEISQFINEVALLSIINHRNIVKLLGCCFEAEAPILVYEFIPNGTLTDHIHVKNRDTPLPWNHRLRIAAEITRALAYLHSAISTPIFHRDLKSANVLLDESLTVKLSDFGASKPIDVDQTHVTTAVHGTLGYLDPEYLQTGQLTEKCDVYSLGVILVELLTGKTPHALINEDETLIMLFLSSLRQDQLSCIIDPVILMEQQGTEGEIVEVANLAARCLKSRGEERPTMKEIEFVLEALLSSTK